MKSIREKEASIPEDGWLEKVNVFSDAWMLYLFPEYRNQIKRAKDKSGYAWNGHSLWSIETGSGKPSYTLRVFYDRMRTRPFLPGDVVRLLPTADVENLADRKKVDAWSCIKNNDKLVIRAGSPEGYKYTATTVDSDDKSRIDKTFTIPTAIIVLLKEAPQKAGLSALETIELVIKRELAKPKRVSSRSELRSDGKNGMFHQGNTVPLAGSHIPDARYERRFDPYIDIPPEPLKHKPLKQSNLLIKVKQRKIVKYHGNKE